MGLDNVLMHVNEHAPLLRISFFSLSDIGKISPVMNLNY